MAQGRKRSARKGGQEKTERPGAQVLGKEMPPHVAWAVMSALVLVLFAPALFVAGFLTNELVSDEGGAAVVAQPSPSAGTPTAAATPTPVVAPTADDDPFVGPADAPVTVILFDDFE